MWSSEILPLRVMSVTLQPLFAWSFLKSFIQYMYEDNGNLGLSGSLLFAFFLWDVLGSVIFWIIYLEW